MNDLYGKGRESFYVLQLYICFQKEILIDGTWLEGQQLKQLVRFIQALCGNSKT